MTQWTMPKADNVEAQLERVACALCGNTETQPLARKGRLGFPAHVSICTQCGLVYLSPRWSKEAYDQFNAAGGEGRPGRGETAPPPAWAPDDRTAELVWDRVAEHVSPPVSSLLDVGCGMGLTLKLLAERLGCREVAGIEMSTEAREHVAGSIAAELIAKDWDTAWHLEYESRFDLIVMRHTLEHVLEPVSLLGKVAHALRPGGRLYVATPDMMAPTGWSLEANWYRAVHTYYFSSGTLAATIARAGLRPVAGVYAEDSELWGVFEAGEFEPGFTSVFVAQRRVIRNHRARWLIRRLLALIPGRVRSMVPAGIEREMRKLLRA